MDTNPIPEFQNFNAILEGIYAAVFHSCEVVERPRFDGEGLETVLKLYFVVPDQEVTITKLDNLRFSPKSNLWKDLRQMSGEGFRSEVFNNREVLWKHIQSLIGQVYTLWCEPSEGGTFTRITNIAAPKKTASQGKTLTPEEDAIPF